MAHVTTAKLYEIPQQSTTSNHVSTIRYCWLYGELEDRVVNFDGLSADKPSSTVGEYLAVQDVHRLVGD